MTSVLIDRLILKNFTVLCWLLIFDIILLGKVAHHIVLELEVGDSFFSENDY